MVCVVMTYSNNISRFSYFTIANTAAGYIGVGNYFYSRIGCNNEAGMPQPFNLHNLKPPFYLARDKTKFTKVRTDTPVAPLTR